MMFDFFFQLQKLRLQAQKFPASDFSNNIEEWTNKRDSKIGFPEYHGCS